MTYYELIEMIKDRISELDLAIEQDHKYGNYARMVFLQKTLVLNKKMLYILTLN